MYIDTLATNLSGFYIKTVLIFSNKIHTKNTVNSDVCSLMK